MLSIVNKVFKFFKAYKLQNYTYTLAIKIKRPDNRISYFQQISFHGFRKCFIHCTSTNFCNGKHCTLYNVHPPTSVMGNIVHCTMYNVQPPTSVMGNSNFNLSYFLFLYEVEPIICKLVQFFTIWVVLEFFYSSFEYFSYCHFLENQNFTLIFFSYPKTYFWNFRNNYIFLV